jgi:hypothetical protein
MTYRYGVSRNMPCEDSVTGETVLMCLCLIEHENGYRQRHVIPESLIQYAGEGIIAIEVQEAAAKGGIEFKEKTK